MTAFLPAANSELRLYLDTADVEQWQTWLPTGVFYGVTTNPLLLERAQVPCHMQQMKDLAEQAFAWNLREVQMQAWGDSLEALVQIGRQLAAMDERIVVKVPSTQMGVEAAGQLIRAGVRVTLTAVYAAPQVLLAAALGAEYTAPYLGRIEDLGGDGRQALVQMQRALTGVNSPTRILVASIRRVEDLAYLAAQGLNTFTISAAIASQLFHIEATEAATADFERAARALGAY
ncbi:Transaldolase [Halomicronema hongdechloris C2206]|uniref:Transaldolase n=1 Tax=Halomicronema hongdechloris C2206 TaxID=1641165 RepID=A0A1Z3HTH4_9CYAN|nr:transaldolase family protein [Halomicronema hongdechloris]ASC73594.1 Transaldolase [Halomicronema hongdechloris C2206]